MCMYVYLSIIRRRYTKKKIEIQRFMPTKKKINKKKLNKLKI